MFFESVISFTEVSERIIYWENYLNRYPNSKLFYKSKEYYSEYLNDYLFGMDNTPTYDFETKLILDETKKEFNRFIKANPKSKSARIVNLFLENSSKLYGDGNKDLSDLIANAVLNTFKPTK